jgi:hypothetical protein
MPCESGANPVLTVTLSYYPCARIVQPRSTCTCIPTQKQIRCYVCAANAQHWVRVDSIQETTPRGYRVGLSLPVSESIERTSTTIVAVPQFLGQWARRHSIAIMIAQRYPSSGSKVIGVCWKSLPVRVTRRCLALFMPDFREDPRNANANVTKRVGSI